LARRKKSFIDASELHYNFSENSLENNFETEGIFDETAQTFYLSTTYGEEKYIPLEIFSSNLAPLQAIVKYSKEVLGLKNQEIAKLLGRDTKTIWLTAKAAKAPLPSIKQSSYRVPITIFKDSTLSALEALVSYLKTSGKTYAEISRLISRDQRTVWTVEARVKRKQKENDN
jgi:DNA-binding CsgD family transcriptional regulator